MKNLIIITAFFISVASFAQNTGSINGVLTDGDMVNEPLILAKVKIKETGAEVLSNDKGFFKFENLAEGNYTLLCSFVGYENQELKTTVVSGTTSQVKSSLIASTISIDDLVLAIASVDSETNSTSTLAQ